MSKKSIIARQAKRERVVAKYHDVRAQLKKTMTMMDFQNCQEMHLRYV